MAVRWGVFGMLLCLAIGFQVSQLSFGDLVAGWFYGANAVLTVFWDEIVSARRG